MVQFEAQDRGLTDGPQNGASIAQGNSNVIRSGGDGFSESPQTRGSKNIVQYIGIAADEPSRFHNLTEAKRSPLVEAGWTEAMCREWCEKNDLLSPIYTTATRGGCWFCHNQGVDQLRILRKNYPEYWALMLKWDLDSPVSFKPDGHTVHDFDARFALEDDGIVTPEDKWKWAYLADEPIQLKIQ